MADILQELISKLSMDADDFTKGIDKAITGGGSFDKFMMGLADKLFSPAGAIAAVTAIGAVAFKTALDFDAAMDSIAANTGATGVTLDRLGVSFDEVFKNVPSDANTVAEAIGALTNRLQLQGKPLEDLSVQFLNLARIHKEELNPLIDASADAFKQWNVATADQSKTLDYFYNIATKSNTTVTVLTGQISTFAESFQDAGMDINQAAEMLGVLNLTGVEVEKVMPAIRKSFMEMAKAGIDPAEGFPALVAEIKSAETNTEALTIGAKAFGPRGGSYLVNAIRMGRLETEAFSASLRASGVSINEMAENTEDFGEKWEKIWHRVQVAILPVGKALMEFLNLVSIGLEHTIPVIEKFYEGWQKAGVAIGQFLTFYALKPKLDETKIATDAMAKAIESISGTSAKASAATKELGDKFETATEKTKRLKDAQEALEKANKALSAEMERGWNNIVHQQEAGEKWRQELIKENEELKRQDAELEAISESARKSTMELTGFSDTSKLIEKMLPPLEGLSASWEEVEQWTQTAIAAGWDYEKMSEGIGDTGNKQLKEHANQWEQFSREVSTILTNLAQDIGKNALNLIVGSDRRKFNQDLEDQQNDLQVSLDGRSVAWETYQVDIATQMQKARDDSATELAGELQDLANSLAERQDAYDSFVEDTADRAGEIREKISNELAGELQDLADSLRDRQQAYDSLVEDAAVRAVEIREKFSKELAGELQDLQENLEDRRGRYAQFVEDTKTSKVRTEEDLKEELSDKKRDVERNISDKTTANKRDTDELKRKIANELALGSKANQQNIHEWRIQLDEKQSDYELYIARQRENYDEFASDQQRSYERETEDLNTELGRRTDDWEKYQQEIKEKSETAVADNRAGLDEELGDLQENLTTKKAELEKYKTIAASKAEALRLSYETKLMEELSDLQTNLTKKGVELEKYKTEAVSKAEVLRSSYEAKLGEELTNLQTNLTDKKAEYDTFKTDIDAKLATLVESHRTAWGDVGTFFGQTLTGMGEALTSWITEYLVGKLFDKLNELVTDILPDVGKALSSNLPDWLGGTPKLPGPPEEGGAVTSVAGSGLAAWISAIGSAVSAITGVIGIFQTANTNDRLWQIEENTRRSMIHLGEGEGSILGRLNFFLPSVDIIRDRITDMMARTYTWFDISNLLTNIRDDMRANLYPQVAALGGAGQAITIPVTVTLDGKVVAESVVTYLESSGTRIT